MLVFLLPAHVFAACRDTGATLIFVNGILNSRKDADESKAQLQVAFQNKFGSIVNIKFITGYNPSHLAGAGDLAQSAAQVLGGSISDYDLKTILMQIQPEVATRKILLVGHSQGTLYANSIYKYLVGNGVPAESIAVYNVATPADKVAGRGAYLTSSNDSLIRKLADIAKKLRTPSPLSPNIDIPIFPGDTEGVYSGHNFIRAYLAGASDKIVSDVSRELDGLAAKTNTDAETCFNAPPSTMGYKIEKAVFAVADPIAGGAVLAARTSVNAEKALAAAIANGVLAAAKGIGNTAAALLAFRQSAQLPAPSGANLAVKPPSELPSSPTLGVGISLTPSVFPESGVEEGEGGGGNQLVEAPAALPTPSVGQTDDLPAFLQLSLVGGGSPGFGGSSPSSSTSDVTPTPYEGGDGGGNGEEAEPPDVTPPDAPAIISPSEDGLVFISSNIDFSGTAEFDSVISNNFNNATTTAGEDGAWQFTFSNLLQGATTIEFSAQDQAGNQSASSARTIFVDSLGPGATLVIEECEEGGSSLSPDGCLLSETGAIMLSWSTDAEDFDYFIVECESGGEECEDFDFSETTDTGASYELPSANTSYAFTVRAVDQNGNIGDADSKTLEVISMPVVINEVAWAGTAADSHDEFIELYNRTSYTINLDGWALYAQDSEEPYINLSGTIQPASYFLLERKDNETVSDVAADLIYGNDGSDWALNNTGEVLVLSQDSTTIDQTTLCSGTWCGGSAGGLYPSMERIDPEVAGTDTANWGTSNGIVKNGMDAAGVALTATPRARNSLHYLIAQSTTLPADRTLKQSFGTYIIKENDTFIVPVGKTLTIEPGVTVKVGGSASLEVNGTLIADGTAANHIIFTSLSDPPTYWKNIRITADSSNSSVSYAQFKYGGRYFSNTPLEQRAELSVINNSINISHSTFENSYGDGLRLTLSNSTVSNNTFSVGTTSSSNVGFEASDGSPTISQNTFLQNYQGLRLNTDTSASVQSNTFTDNFDYAVYAVNGASEFSGNSGSGNGNGKNGIALVGTISAAGGTTTLSANPLSYLIGRYPSGNPKVAAGSVLVVGAGTVWKGEANDARFEIDGTMKLEGANKDSILFTSLADSAPGEWYGITLSSTGYVYGGGFTLRHGGGAPSCSGCAGFSVIGGRVNLSDGRIQNNYKVGMQIYNSATSTLSNFEFLDHQTPAGNSTALVSSNSTLILDNLIFSNNFANTSPEGLY